MRAPAEVAELLDQSKREYTRLKLRAAGLRSLGQNGAAAEVAIVMYRLEGAIDAFEAVLSTSPAQAQIIEGEVVTPRQLPDAGGGS